jgi:hypothetical protein
MTPKALYLHTNRHFAERAALLGADSKDRATESTFLIYLANLLTLAHFAEAALGFVISRAALRALDRAVDKGVNAAQNAARRFWQSMMTKFRAELKTPSPTIDHTDYDMVTAQADQFIPVLLLTVSQLSNEELTATLNAAESAAAKYLETALQFPKGEAVTLAKLLTADIRDAAEDSRVSRGE